MHVARWRARRESAGGREAAHGGLVGRASRSAAGSPPELAIRAPLAAMHDICRIAAEGAA